eukprot:TRINITY_DN20722_c0_g1_i2.p1 TRINITY_DN20722_c0_g1~~TRINITY_DN20722_c0_g1_i2.p1  ORF type:complete len:1843 (+),score=742.04 TRINITY_DN20722_c0_g1_i2:72-5531(+)
MEEDEVPREVQAGHDEDDDDDDDLLNIRKRKRDEEEENFVFSLLAPEGPLDETSPIDVRSKFMRMFFETKLSPAAEREIVREIYEGKERRVERKKKVTTAEVRERQRKAAEAVAREHEDIERFMSEQAKPATELTEEERQQTAKAQQVEEEYDEEMGEEELENKRNMEAAQMEAMKFFGDVEGEESEWEGVREADKVEAEAFKEISGVKKKKIKMRDVIPPEDMKRLYLRPVDDMIVKTDLPERYQLQLESVNWTQEQVLETFFSTSQDPLQWMVHFIYSKLFRNSVHTPQMIEQVLTYIFKYGNEPVFVQRYCMLRENTEDSCTLDDVWAIWNGAFEFISIYNRREKLKEQLHPIHEALAEGLFSEQLGSSRFPTSTKAQKINMSRRIQEQFESIALDMYYVSFAELSTKGTQAKWTWEPHYLTWIEKWMSHWDDVFNRVCTMLNTQTSYNMRIDDNNMTRISRKRNEAVRYRSHNLFHFALMFSAHPSTIAMALTSSSNEDYTRALIGRVQLTELPNEKDRERVDGLQHMTLTKPTRSPAQSFESWLSVANSMHHNMWGTGTEGANRLKVACVEMLSGSLSAEPRFRQILLDLLIGVGDQSVMSLGRIRVQPSTTGFGYFKQGGQTRVGYRNLCLNSRKFTSELKEEIVKYIESGLMVYWFEVDDPSKIKREIENDLFKAEGMTEAQSISASSHAASTTMTAMTAMTQQLEVNRLNNKREALTASVNISDLDVWYPSEQTFEQFKHKIKKRKTEIITSVLRDAHRDQGNINLSKLPFVPLDEWYTSRPIVDDPESMTPEQRIACEWADIRVEIIEKAVYQALDDVESILWDKISAEVQEKVLADAAAGLRKMVLRAGYQSYKLKSGVMTDGNDVAAQRLLLDEEMFTSNEPTDFILDPADSTPPGRYRVAGVVYDDVMKQHTICFLDEFGNYLDSFELAHLVMKEEDPLVREKLDDMQVRLRKCIFTFRPQAWAIGMTHSTDLQVREMLRKFNVDWQAMLEDKDLSGLLPTNFKPPKIEMVDARIARVWARSRDAFTELRDLDESRKKAVAVGRTLRSPLSAVASLFTADRDSLSLALSEMQDIVPKLSLLRRMEQQMVSIVAVVGLDINHVLNGVARSEHGLLQFLPGFGPRKALHLYRKIAGQVPLVSSRKELKKEPFKKFFGNVVYRNAAGFVKVLFANKTAEKQKALGLYEHTLDRTRIHPSFYGLVTMVVHSVGVGLEIFDAADLATMTPKQYNKTMLEKTREMMEDIEEKKRAGRLEEAGLMLIDWQVMKDEWHRQYQSTASFVEDEDEAALFDSVPLPDLMQVVREELIRPYEIRPDPEDELHSMAEYRPTHDDIVFDTIVDDRSITQGSLRIVNVMVTTPTGLRVRISGCDAARGVITRAETLPGSKHSEQDWSLYRDEWFKRGMQFEAVVTKIVKSSFLVMLSIDTEKVKEAKMKVDKHFKEMEKALKLKEKQAGNISATASQTGTLETISQTGTQMTFPFTETQTITSTIDSQVDPMLRGEKPMFHVPEEDGGPLLSHPLFIPSIETQAQATTKLLETDKATGRDYFKPGDLLMRPDVRCKLKNRFKIDIRMHDHPVIDEKNVFGLGFGKELKRTAFLTFGFEVRSHGVVVEEPSPHQKGDKEGEQEMVTLHFDDVDHMIHTHVRQWFKQTLELRRHHKWDDRAPQYVRKHVVNEEIKNRKAKVPGERYHIFWRMCPADAQIVESVDGGPPTVKVHAMRFLVIFPGIGRELSKHRTRQFLFEARRDHFVLIRNISSKIRNPTKMLRTLRDVAGYTQKAYSDLVENMTKINNSARNTARGASPSLDMG